MNLGADDYVTKPFEEIELLEAIESRLKKRQRFEAVMESNDKWKGFQDAVCDLTGLDGLKDSAQVKTIGRREDRKSTRLNSSHVRISYAVFCLKKKKKKK